MEAQQMKKALGKGLDSLIRSNAKEASSTNKTTENNLVFISDILPNKNHKQIRKSSPYQSLCGPALVALAAWPGPPL